MNPRVAIAIGLLLSAACATSPTGRRQLMLVSDTQMATLGHQAFEKVQEEQTVETDPHINQYVRCVAGAVARALPRRQGEAPWEVVVFQDKTPNAFALPGRKIGVHTGLLDVANTPDQVAAVVGHEIGHVLARHSHERVSNTLAANAGLSLAGALVGGMGSGEQQAILGALGVGAQVGILLPYSRAHESEADLLGLELMARAGFDPRAAVTLWENMERASSDRPAEFLSTHPAPATRMTNLRARMPEALRTRDHARRAGRRPNCRAP